MHVIGQGSALASVKIYAKFRGSVAAVQRRKRDEQIPPCLSILHSHPILSSQRPPLPRRSFNASEIDAGDVLIAQQLIFT